MDDGLITLYVRSDFENAGAAPPLYESTAYAIAYNNYYVESAREWLTYAGCGVCGVALRVLLAMMTRSALPAPHCGTRGTQPPATMKERRARSPNGSGGTPWWDSPPDSYLILHSVGCPPVGRFSDTNVDVNCGCIYCVGEILKKGGQKNGA